MTAGFSVLGTVRGSSFERPSATVSIETIGTAAGLRMAVADGSHGATTLWDLTGSGAPRLTATDWHLPATRVPVALGNRDASLAQTVIDTAMAAWDTGAASGASGQLAYLSTAAVQADSAIVLGARLGGLDLLFVAQRNGDGISSHVLDAAGTPGAPRLRIDSSKNYLDKVADMAVIATATGTFLVAGSSSEHGLSSYRIRPDGTLSDVGHIGRAQSLPIQGVTAIETAAIDGQAYVVVTASGSSSVTVLEMDSRGALRPVDQVIDSLHTRFANAAQLEVVTVAGHVFVIVAGSDDGLSLFALSPGGRLIHLDTIADTAATPLAGLSGLAAQAVAGGIEILTTSAREAGAGHLGIAFANPGVVRRAASGTLVGSAGDDMLELLGEGLIDAGAGDDILLDGSGADTLSGGAGRDVFVMRRDGMRDVITDIRVGEDRLDLSGWGFLYSTAQIALQATPWGGVLSYGDEVLELRTADARPLTAADIAALAPLPVSHVDVTPAPLEQAAPAPAPDPFPATVPGPDPWTAPQPDPDAPALPLAGAGLDPLKLTGTALADLLVGAAGNDTIAGGAGNDTLIGGDGDDAIKGQAGDDLIHGGAGNDRLPGEDGNDTIHGEDGDDSLGGGNGDDHLDGGNGDDRGGGGPGNDMILAGEGNDIFSGGPGNDTLFGQGGNDRLAGSYGHDFIDGGPGNDRIGGGWGNDTILAGEGDDVVGAGEHDDMIDGGAGDDFLGGGPGNDTIWGGTGNDTINPGHGDDVMYGGAGRDTFVFNSFVGGGIGIIEDFEIGLDLIQLAGRRLPAADPLGALGMSDTTIDGEAAALLSYGDHRIYLLGIGVAQLSVDDFLYT